MNGPGSSNLMEKVMFSNIPFKNNNFGLWAYQNMAIHSFIIDRSQWKIYQRTFIIYTHVMVNFAKVLNMCSQETSFFFSRFCIEFTGQYSYPIEIGLNYLISIRICDCVYTFEMTCCI